jgi:hypothetical protein
VATRHGAVMPAKQRVEQDFARALSRMNCNGNLCRSRGFRRPVEEKGPVMLWTIAVILFVLWILGFSVFHVAGGLIHILLVIAVIVIIFQLITGRRV